MKKSEEGAKLNRGTNWQKGRVFPIIYQRGKNKGPKNQEERRENLGITSRGIQGRKEVKKVEPGLFSRRGKGI